MDVLREQVVAPWPVRCAAEVVRRTQAGAVAVMRPRGHAVAGGWNVVTGCRAPDRLEHGALKGFAAGWLR
jgi:hypothetical protein